MKHSSRRHPRPRRTVPVLVAALLLGALALAAGRPAAPAPAAAQPGPSRIYLPLSLDGVLNEEGGSVPTAAPTEPPTAPPTPEATATPAASPTATPYVCGPLEERIKVSAVDVSPKEVKTSPSRGRNTYPIYLAPLRDGGAKIAWAELDGGVNVTTVDANDVQVADDIELNGSEVRGLVAHDDGGTALMTVSGVVLTMLRLDESGETIFENDLIGLQSQTTTGSKWVDDWGHESRLVWADGEYGLYTGHTQYFGAAQGKHQGDLLWHFDADGNRKEGRGWDWGCSHSLDLRLAHNGTRWGPACLSDSYPQKAFMFNHREAMIWSEPTGDARGGSDGRLGGWVPLEDGFLMSFASPTGRRSTDVAVIKVYDDGGIGSPHWLTDTPGITEDAPHLARLGRDEYLASWMSNGKHMLVVIDEFGEVLEGPVETEAQIAAKDDFMTMPDGDVAWAAAWGDDEELKIVRVDACGSPPIATPVPPTATPTPRPSATPDGPTRTPTPGPTPTETDEPTPRPQVCEDLLANGGFDAGFDGWTTEGEIALGFSDRGSGQFGAELLGRNDTTASLRQRVSVPPDAASAHLTYWWKMDSAEAETSTEAYDHVSVSAAGQSAVLERISNLSGRDAWRPSAYALAPGSVTEVAFRAESNKRDATSFLIDDVALVVCTGEPHEPARLTVDPASGRGGGLRLGSGLGFTPREMVSHWMLAPESRDRHDVGQLQADTVGGIGTPLQIGQAAGTWRWAAAGEESGTPGIVELTVTGLE